MLRERPVTPTLRRFFNYKRGDYQEIAEHIRRVNWNALLDRPDGNAAYEAFLEEYHSACHRFIPSISNISNRRKRYPWVNDAAAAALKRKHELFYTNGQRGSDEKRRRGDILMWLACWSRVQWPNRLSTTSTN